MWAKAVNRLRWVALVWWNACGIYMEGTWVQISAWPF